jgi:predicted nucleic acid-binding protein
MLVIDASVAVKLVAEEGGADEAISRVAGEPGLIAPDWVRIEVGHTLWRKAGMGLLIQSDSEACLLALPTFFEQLYPSGELLAHGFQLAFALGQGVYDCLYMALALREDGILLTADRKFWNAAKRAGFSDRVELLTWPGQT